MNRLIPILLVLLSLALACTQAQPTPTPPPPTATPAPTPTPVPTATPTRAPAASPTTSAGGMGALAGSSEALNKLKSYRYKLIMSGKSSEGAQPGGTPQFQTGSFTMEGAHVSPDRDYFKFGTDQAGASPTMGSIEGIIIGNKMWTKFGNQWTETPAAQGAQFKGLSPAESWKELTEDFPNATIKPAGKETVNGVATQHFTLTLPNLGTQLGTAGVSGDASGDIWVAEDGQWPVKMRIGIKVSGAQAGSPQGEVEMIMDITNVNDATIKIEPPTP